MFPATTTWTKGWTLVAKRANETRFDYLFFTYQLNNRSIYYKHKNETKVSGSGKRMLV